MRQRHFLLFLNLLIACVVFAQDKDIEDLMRQDDYISASLMVVSPGEKIYSAGGHLALRMKCPVQDVDYVYEFDAVLDDDESLIFAYLNGTLKGQFVRLFASDFCAKVYSENREFIEYPLNLTPEQEVRLWSCVDDEVDSNSIYPFKPTSDNCCSKMLTILEESVEDNLFTKSDVNNLSETTGRDHLEDFFECAPWTGLLWDVLIGHEFDRPASVINLIYPKIIGESLSSIKNPANNKPLVAQNDCPEALFNPTGTHIFRPEYLFSAILIFSIFLSIMNVLGRLNRASLFFDIILIFTIGLTGIVLWYIFLASIIHNDIQFNTLLIIFTPVPLVLLFLRNKKLWDIYALITAVISIVFLIGINYIPQIKIYGLWLFIAALSVRSLCHLRIMKTKFHNLN